MDLSKVLKFTCRECGSHELGYQKYVKCLTPVTIQDEGQMVYGLSEIDEDDYLCTENSFICMNCKGPVKHCGFKFETEQQLFYYLEVDPEVRDREHQVYVENLNAMMDEIPEYDDDLDLL